MAEPAKTMPVTAPEREPVERKPLSREDVRAMAERVIARYPRMMAKLAE